MAKLSVDQAMLRAKSHLNKGEIERAKALYETVLAAFPNNQRAKQGLTNLNKPAQVDIKDPPQLDALIALYNHGKFADAVAQAEKLTEDYSHSFLLWNILGAAYKELGRLDKAEDRFRRATEIKPDYADAHYNLGVVLRELSKLDEAIASCQRALKIKPDYVNAHNNMGLTLEDQGKPDEAIASYQQAINIKPDHANAHYNMGNAFKNQSKLEAAISSYKKAIKIKPDNAKAYNNMGIALQAVSKLDEAIASFEQALQIEPEFADAHYNLGNAFENEGKLGDAIVSYKKALRIKPNYAHAHYNMGNALKVQGKLDQAIASYKKTLNIKPDYPAAQSQLLHQINHVCDFAESIALADLSASLGVDTDSISPFPALTWADDAQKQLVRSQKWAKEKYKQAPLPLAARPHSRPTRLKIGYFSADFHNFPGMYLMAGLLEQHDRSKFEIHAFSYGPQKSDEMRQRIIKAVDHFIDIREMPVDDVVKCATGIDIAIHRNGYTTNSRTEIFARRVAPVQINYLGYPGSLGADFIDYIIADPVVIPQDQRPFYSEKVIYLPHSYQPNDDTREIAQTHTTRADFELPEDGFVFCCFNNSYKISPTVFDIWMRLLNKVEGSVLWLLKTNTWAEQNLRKQAQQRGIDPSRLIFADREPQAKHLARHKHADLFIDTFNYNAHTTASDALWAGLPVVTKQGKQFAARVAASLLTAIGLPELITETEADYEALILDLATNPDKLWATKEKLANNRLSQPLFDTKRYTSDFEAGLTSAYDLYFADKTPKDITVKAT